MPDINAILPIILSAGGALFLRSIIDVIRGWRADKFENEGTLIERLDRRNKILSLRSDQLFEERNRAREEAADYRRLAWEYAPREKVEALSAAWEDRRPVSSSQRKLPGRRRLRRREIEEVEEDEEVD